MNTNVESEKVLKFIEANPKSDQKKIEAGTGLTADQITEITKQLSTDGKIVNKKMVFSLPSVEAAKVAKAPKVVKAKTAPQKIVAKAKAKLKKVVKKVSAAAKRTADNFNRNFGRYRFNGNEYPKGRACLAVVKMHVEKHPKITFAQLQNDFPDDLMPVYGIIRDLKHAKKASASGKKRYFINEEHVIKLKDGSVVAVANQFSSLNITKFVKNARKLGYNMTPSKK